MGTAGMWRLPCSPGDDPGVLRKLFDHIKDGRGKPLVPVFDMGLLTMKWDKNLPVGEMQPWFNKATFPALAMNTLGFVDPAITDK